MAAEEQNRLQIGHVLFIDVVDYSKLLVNQQSELLRELNEVVSGTHEFRQAEAGGKLTRLPTGDGMALVFRTDPEAPAQCALEIARVLKEHPLIALRMGIHSGPVNEVVDVNQRENIAGAGINLAQRVMDCGDAGHILVSKHVADDLEQHHRWRPLLHDLGPCEVKHGSGSRSAIFTRMKSAIRSCRRSSRRSRNVGCTCAGPRWQSRYSFLERSSLPSCLFRAGRLRR